MIFIYIFDSWWLFLYFLVFIRSHIPRSYHYVILIWFTYGNLRNPLQSPHILCQFFTMAHVFCELFYAQMNFMPQLHDASGYKEILFISCSISISMLSVAYVWSINVLSFQAKEHISHSATPHLLYSVSCFTTLITRCWKKWSLISLITSLSTIHSEKQIFIYTWFKLIPCISVFTNIWCSCIWFRNVIGK